jgi:hypothetical protein
MQDPVEEAVQDFLDGRPRAEELREMRLALLKRLEAMEEDLAAHPDDERLAARVRAARRQVAVLAEEEAITGFVEDTVRVSVLNETVPAPEPPPAPPTVEPGRPAWADIDIDDVPEAL